MPTAPPKPSTRAPHMGVVAVLLAGAFLVTWVLAQGRNAARDLLLLVGFAMLAFVVGRAAWRWWRARAAVITKAGLVAAYVCTGAGWLTVLLLQRLSHVSSENFIWIIMWPLMMLLGLAAGVAGLAGAGLGAAVVVSAPAERKPLFVAGGIVAAMLNLWHVERLVRLLVTG